MERMEFVKRRNGRRVFWCTEKPKARVKDFNTGRRYARQLVVSIQERDVSPFFLSEVVAEFPAELSAIEEGFLAEIGKCLLTLRQAV